MRYESVSEIVREDGEWVRPLAQWDIEVLDRNLSVNFGDLGGRQDFVANARVRVTEEDGTSWTGLTLLG